MNVYGLEVLVSEAVPRGTLHVISPPPAREDFASDAKWEAAYDEWWRGTTCWTVTNIGDEG